MTIIEYPRLCGGTFFTLVLQALKQRMKAREHYKGESDGLTDPDVLMGLIRVINPDFVEPMASLKGKTNDYKSCTVSTGTYLPFGDTAVIDAFDKRVRTSYSEALNSMAAFVERFIDSGDAVRKDLRLVKALLDLIEQDVSIPEETFLYVNADGSAEKKAALGGLTEICLPAFLLGVWHYTVVNRKDNSVGKATYNRWCPPAGGAQRVYTANMGVGKYDRLKVTQFEITEPCVDDEGDPETAEAEVIDIPVAKQGTPTQQTVNNPFVFNFTQNGDNNTQIGYVENYHAGRKE